MLLPQAIRAMMPVIVAQLVVTLKDTALGFIITYPELLYVIKLLGSNAVYSSPLIQTAIIGGTIYVAMCLALSYVAYRIEQRTKRRQQQQAAEGGALHHPVGATTDTQLIGLQQSTDRSTGNEGGGPTRLPRRPR